MAEMVIFMILDLVSVMLIHLEGFVMKVFVNPWRNRLLKHIEKTTIHDRIEITAYDVGLVPQLTITWILRNNSMVNMTVSEVFGELWVGAWRMSKFIAHTLSEKQLGYDKSPTITIRRKLLKKDDWSEIEVTLFPPIEFWLNDNNACFLYNAGVLVRTFWGDVITKPQGHSIAIKNIETVRTMYRGRLRTKLNKILS